MHIVVTGAGGFSGAHIAQALLARGQRVTAVVGRSRGRLSVQDARLEVVGGDLSAGVALPAGVDAVVHAAARSPVPGVAVDDYVRDNIIALRRLLAWSREARTKTFIFLSSFSVYGAIDAPVVDETTPIVSAEPYGVSKWLGEQMVAAEKSFRSVSIRLPGVVGPASIRNWLSTVMERARDGREISVFNPEGAFNNAIHVADLAHFISDLIEGDWQGADVVTTGAAGQTTIMGAARLIVEAFGGRSPISVRPADKRGFILSSERARARYGYRPAEILSLLRRFAAENGARQA